MRRLAAPYVPCVCICTRGRLGEDEKKRASPDYENENGHADVQRDPSWRTDAAKVVAGLSMEAEPECPRVFWLGMACTEGLSTWASSSSRFPTLPGPDIVEPEATAATAPTAFAEDVDAETEDCFALSAEIKGEGF